MTASILTTFYEQVFNNNKCPIQTERSAQWSFERLRRPDDGYCLAETCGQCSVF
jgi:hypothetical protein